MPEPRVTLAGDSTLLVEFEARIDAEINARVVALAGLIEDARFEGVRDVVPTYKSVGVHFAPLRTNVDRLVEDLKRLASQAQASTRTGGAFTEVPVRYGGKAGPDLSDVARHAGCSEAEVVERHAARTYRVYMLGFLPGFAYMGMVDPRIATPRLTAPRTRIPAGSVAIADEQTGIYPADSPGGWRVIGRTPVRPFDPSRSEAFLFKPGDTVRFVPA